MAECSGLSVRREKEKCVPFKLYVQRFSVTSSEIGSMLHNVLRRQVTRVLVRINVYESKLKCEN